jgi:hypothetical protein
MLFVLFMVCLFVCLQLKKKKDRRRENTKKNIASLNLNKDIRKREKD